MQLLTSSAMTVLRVQWLLPAQLVLYLPAMTAGFVSNVEIWIVAVDFVGSSMLPLVELTFCAPGIAIVAIRLVRRFLCHVPVAGMELDLVQASNCSRYWAGGSCRCAEVS